MDRSPGFGSITCNSRAIHTRFPFGSGPSDLNLAAYNNSPDHSTKGTTSRLNALCVLVNIWFQVLFHSAPAVLFTFPSRYFLYRSSSSVSPWMVVHPASHWVPRAPWYSGSLPPCRLFAYEGLTLFAASSQMLPLSWFRFMEARNPRSPKSPGLGSPRFARRYSGVLG